MKAHRLPCPGPLLRNTQLELILLFSYGTIIKLFKGSGRLRLCYGKPGVELVRKTGLCEWGRGEP